ncbi:hypothetical protein CKAN_00485900 [Cinnamomum micranthum f. kanehirae]|uniref:Uncharacterized protein n=1 Tax=Cinnamomum micranthum f. kanehirae TaxID=337451 RepID=A0A3S3PZE3_9MAGN|nr:hypothetical protein CKAN_00485900 [Cinnamomum micranthum f. kanehirae]
MAEEEQDDDDEEEGGRSCTSGIPASSHRCVAVYRCQRHRKVVVERTQHGSMHIWKIHKILIGSNVIFVAKYQMEVFIGSSNTLLGVSGILLLVQNVQLKLENRLEST